MVATCLRERIDGDEVIDEELETLDDVSLINMYIMNCFWSKEQTKTDRNKDPSPDDEDRRRGRRTHESMISD